MNRKQLIENKLRKILRKDISVLNESLTTYKLKTPKFENITVVRSGALGDLFIKVEKDGKTRFVNFSSDALSELIKVLSKLK